MKMLSVNPLTFSPLVYFTGASHS